MTWIVAYIAAAIVFFAIDYVWLSKVAFKFYRAEIGPILREKPNMPAAGAFYLFYLVGIVFFAIAPALAEQSWMRGLLTGGFLGLIAYGTYDMTNLATIKDWSAKVAVIDMIWGAALTGTAAVAGYFAVVLILG